jgi:hypothetical protein
VISVAGVVNILGSAEGNPLWAKQGRKLRAAPTDPRFDGAFGNAQPLCDFPVVQFVQEFHAHDFPHLRRDLLSLLQNDFSGFTRGGDIVRRGARIDNVPEDDDA